MSFASCRTITGIASAAMTGGYYLLRLREEMPFLFEETPGGTDQVFALMQRRAERGIAPAVLERPADLDRPEDLARWPRPVE